MKKTMIMSALFISNSIFAEDFGNKVEELMDNQMKMNQEFTESIQLMSKEEKMEMINAHIKKIKKEQKQMEMVYEQGLALQKSIEEKVQEKDKSIEEKEKKILEYKKELEAINKNLKEVQTIIAKENSKKEKEEKIKNEIKNKNVIVSISKIPLLNKDNAKEVYFTIEDNKKINLIEYKIQKNDILSNIIKQTYFETPSWIEIEERIKIVTEMNKNIKNPNRLNVGDVIYIPYFK